MTHPLWVSCFTTPHSHPSLTQETELLFQVVSQSFESREFGSKVYICLQQEQGQAVSCLAVVTSYHLSLWYTEFSLVLHRAEHAGVEEKALLAELCVLASVPN